MQGLKVAAPVMASCFRKLLACLNLCVAFTEKFRGIHSEWKVCDSQKTDALESSRKIDGSYRQMGHMQPAHVTEKDVLEYVLSYFELPKPEYCSEVVEEGYEDLAKLCISYIEEIGCGGNTKFRGYQIDTTTLAEQFAADRALTYLKTKFRLELWI